MSTAFAYDALEYPAHVLPQMHPSRLAAIGRLHGLACAPPSRCRLLEVGCGDGLQLLALAMAYPQSQFVGIDMSRNAIARGEAFRQRLGLENLRLVPADLTRWDPGREGFDYITAHGFYSWVPQQVRDHLLALCRQRLASAGIAYVSYNALPGCHLRRVMWDMLRHHCDGIEEPAARIASARQFLGWLGAAAPDGKPYAAVLRDEAADLLRRTDLAVLFHDDLAGINEPLSITAFAGQAQAHGLRFLAEADYHEMSDAALAPEARPGLAALADGDVLQREQYLDFLKGRRFRQTLLCHAEAAIARPAQAEAIRGLHAVGHMQRDDADASDAGTVGFRSGDGAALSTDHPVIQAALDAIAEAFPSPLAFTDLLALARAASASAASHDEDADALTQALLSGFEHGLLALHCEPPQFQAEPGATPRASALARLQLEAGADCVASLRPSMVRLDSRLAVELVQLLDGSRDHAALLADLALRMSALPAAEGDGPAALRPAAWWRQKLAPQLADGLRQAARMALLEA
ncbi:MAG: hypothetical protein ABS98_16800 [Lysobacteraceae bacterium SCN 69-48]|nr:MAG: hypothetical protein ABS98_16800 [Xanthomonadaceae bacterium SCN 69-48]